MRVIHIISALYQGGAESQLEKLIYYSQSESIEHIVISLKNDETPLMLRLRKNGVNVYTIGLNGMGAVFAFIRLIKLLKQLHTSKSVFQCWMYHGNFFGMIAGILLGISNKIVWNIRRTELPNGITGIFSNLSAKLSNIVRVNIVCCAEAAMHSHVKAGYNNNLIKVIHNGIDTTLFVPDYDRRSIFRNKINVADHDFIIGAIGRYAPIKGHLNLLKAFQILVSKLVTTNIKLVLIGRDIEKEKSLQSMFIMASMKGKIIILDEQNDIWNAYPGFDVFCLPSQSEGFPNVVAESMSCGVPAIVTDVGDAALIVNDESKVVPIEQPEALANCLLEFIDLSESVKKETAVEVRELIDTRFSIERAWHNYHELYKTIIGTCL